MMELNFHSNAIVNDITISVRNARERDGNPSRIKMIN